MCVYVGSRHLYTDCTMEQSYIKTIKNFGRISKTFCLLSVPATVHWNFWLIIKHFTHKSIKENEFPPKLAIINYVMTLKWVFMGGTSTCWRACCGWCDPIRLQLIILIISELESLFSGVRGDLMDAAAAAAASPTGRLVQSQKLSHLQAQSCRMTDFLCKYTFYQQKVTGVTWISSAKNEMLQNHSVRLDSVKDSQIWSRINALLFIRWINPLRTN